ncbi:uncharacterized protein LOC144343698 [Saccoglossus kowalevskii]
MTGKMQQLTELKDQTISLTKRKMDSDRDGHKETPAETKEEPEKEKNTPKNSIDFLSKHSRDRLHIKANQLEQGKEKTKQELADKFLAEKERLEVQCREISTELYELRLANMRQNKLKRTDDDDTAQQRRPARWRRRRIRTISKEELERRRQAEIQKRVKERLPKSVRKFVNRMMRHRQQTYGVTSLLLSDTSTSSGEESDDEQNAYNRTPFMGKHSNKIRLKHRQISPVPSHLLKVPKIPKFAENIEPIIDIEHTVFGSIRPPVFRQFPNNNWQKTDRFSHLSLTDKSLSAIIRPHLSTREKSEDNNRVHNSNSLLETTRQSYKQAIQSHPLGWQLEQTTKRQMSAPTSRTNSCPMIKPRRFASADESGVTDDAKSDGELHFSSKQTLPRITLRTPATRTSRHTAEKEVLNQTVCLSPSRLPTHPRMRHSLKEPRYLRITPLTEPSTH